MAAKLRTLLRATTAPAESSTTRGQPRIASSISVARGCPESRVPYAQGPWGPSDLRVHICRARSAVPAVCCDPQNREPHIFRAGPLGSIRFASSISSTRVLGCPAFVATLQNREPHIFRAGPLGSIRFASSISSTRVLWHPAFVATLQNREFDMFHADPPPPRRKTGGFYWDPSEMQVRYVPRTAREAQQKNGWILLRPFRNASVLCSADGPRGPAESRVDFNQTLQKCK